MSDLDHPCKQTCSGWKQGYEKGVQEMQAKLALATKALEKITHDEWEVISESTGMRQSGPSAAAQIAETAIATLDAVVTSTKTGSSIYQPLPDTSLLAKRLHAADCVQSKCPSCKSPSVFNGDCMNMMCAKFANHDCAAHAEKVEARGFHHVHKEPDPYEMPKLPSEKAAPMVDGSGVTINHPGTDSKA